MTLHGQLPKWRSVLVQNTLRQQEDTAVMDGPPKGLDFLPQSAKGYYAVGIARRMPTTRVLVWLVKVDIVKMCS